MNNEPQQYIDRINSIIWNQRIQIQDEIRICEQYNLEKFAETLHKKNDRTMKNLYGYVSNKKQTGSE